MQNGIEKEYKILLTKDQFQSLCSHYENLTFIKQVNTYYDTVDHAIQKKHGAMRIREKNGLYCFTLKMYQGNDLMEHECIVPINAASVFDQDDIKELLASYDIHGPFFELAACVTHRAMVIDEDAELCFDINDYCGITDYEVEYEYLRAHDGFTKFNNILKQINQTYSKNCISKVQRTMEALHS